MEKITSELLQDKGEKLQTAYEGTCILYEYEGKKYIVLNKLSNYKRKND